MKHRIHMIGTTHFDPVWLWTWDEAMASIRSTFRSALQRMREDPDFIYSFSCPPVFEWIRNVDSRLFEEIRKRVGEGRWQLVEGWWVQPDCSTAMGESYVRHGLYGQRYLKKTFGMTARGGFNTDSFGHSAMLPQILKKAGMDFYVFGRPSPAEKALPGPLFVWEAPDGSRVLAFRSGGEGANSYSRNLAEDIRKAGNTSAGLGHDLLMLYGVSDHGGAPTKEAIRLIRSLIEEKGKAYDVLFSQTDDFFDRQDQAGLPVVRDELIVKFFGVFSNHTEVKRNNRRGEYRLLNAEKASLLAGLLFGEPCPREPLNRCWKDLLFNQFHDILGGASIKDAYFDARNLHGRVLQTAGEILHYGIQRISREIDTRGPKKPDGLESNALEPSEGFNLVVWNLNARDMTTPIEGEIQWAWEFDWYRGPLSITDDSGRAFSCQIIQERSVLPGFRSRFVFTDTVPSLGYKTYYIGREESRPFREVTSPANDFTIEGRRFRLEVCPKTGCIRSLFDKLRDREVLKDSARAVIQVDEGDTWCFNIDGFGPETGAFSLESVRLVENGPVRSMIRTKGRFGQSTFEQDYLLYRDEDIIEGHFRVFWQERHRALKLLFDCLMEDLVVTSSIPYGSIERSCDGREMPTGEWLDLSDEDRGISLLMDSFFAYDVKGSVLGMTLLRSPIYGHLTWKDPIDPRADYDIMEQGVREGRWRICVHDGDWRLAKIPEEAASFNNPVITVAEAPHTGTLPAESSFLKVDSSSSALVVFKHSEDGGDIILRLYEYAGERDEVVVSVMTPERSIRTTMNPYEIKTLRLLQNADWKAVDVDLLETEPANG